MRLSTACRRFPGGRLLPLLAWAGASILPAQDATDGEPAAGEDADLPRSWVIDDSRFFTDAQKGELTRRIERLKRDFNMQMAVVSAPARIGETVHTDCRRREREWFSSRGQLGGVILAHRGTREAALVTNLHLRTTVKLIEIRRIYEAAAEGAIKANLGKPYEKAVYEAAVEILDELHKLLTRYRDAAAEESP